MMGLGGEAWLAAAAAASAALLLRGLGAYRTHIDRQALGDDALLERLTNAPMAAQRFVRAGLLAAGCGALAAGLAVGGMAEDVPEESNLQTVVVLDASNSMWAQDVEPSRLERQRQWAAELAIRLPGRLGVVYFAGRGYVLSPLTEDRDAVLMFVQALDPGLVGQGGTSLVEGLRQGLDVLAGGDERGPRALVVMSDGEATTEAEAIEEASARARRMGVAVHAVGLGTTTGARVPVPERADTDELETTRDPSGDRESGDPWLIDERGNPVVSRLSEETLRGLSGATGGVYVTADLEGLDALVDRMTGDGGRPRPDAGRRVSALLLAAFALLFAEGYLVRRG